MGTRSGDAFEASRVKRKNGRNTSVSECAPKREKRRIGSITVRPVIVFLAIFAIFAGDTFAQDLDSLSRSIQTGTSEQKRDTLFQIRNMRSEIASRIALPALKDADPIVRATAASSVTFLPKTEAITALTPLLEDKQPFVRKEAAYGLSAVASPEAASPLLKLLEKERDYEVKTAAVIALGPSGNTNVVKYLTNILNSKPKDDEDFLRRSAARSIGLIAQVTKTGSSYPVTPQNFLPDKYKQTGTLTPANPHLTSAVPTLARVLQNKGETDDTRREAAFALGAIGDQSAVSVLESQLNSPDNYLAEICKEALIKIGNR